MAQFELSEKQAQLLGQALRMVEIPWMDAGLDHDPLVVIRDRVEGLQFNLRNCLKCGKKFEAAS